MKPGVIKALGFLLPIVSVGVSLISGIVEDKKLDATVAEKVAEALKQVKES